MSLFVVLWLARHSLAWPLQLIDAEPSKGTWDTTCVRRLKEASRCEAELMKIARACDTRPRRKGASAKNTDVLSSESKSLVSARAKTQIAKILTDVLRGLDLGH
eukprot:6475619-Amphidinium_carterae.2